MPVTDLNVSQKVTKPVCHDLGKVKTTIWVLANASSNWVIFHFTIHVLCMYCVMYAQANYCCRQCGLYFADNISKYILLNERSMFCFKLHCSLHIRVTSDYEAQCVCKEVFPFAQIHCPLQQNKLSLKCKYRKISRHTQNTSHRYLRDDSRLVPNQWETSLQCNAVSHGLCANLQSALYYLKYTSISNLMMQTLS